MTWDIPDIEAWLQVRRTSPGDMLRIQTLDRCSDAGQDIRILDLDEQPAAGALQRTGDFWVVEHQHVALVRYDDQGHHQGEVAVEDTSATGYVAAAELAWQLGVPFADWWAAHPQYRRAAQAA
ncbi:MAG: DUF6879 family protein [Pseudonocardiaceae bacterium]